MRTLYADENVWAPVVEGLRRRGWEITSVREAGTLGDTDREHLEYASERGWTILTFDDDSDLPVAGRPVAGRQR
jgi:predicted nuclease of predicted toxin-antitoxin system